MSTAVCSQCEPNLAVTNGRAADSFSRKNCARSPPDIPDTISHRPVFRKVHWGAVHEKMENAVSRNDV